MHLLLLPNLSCVGKQSLLLQSDLPTLPDCLEFRGKERIINLPKEIGTRYLPFGKLLLEDDTGMLVDSIVRKHSDSQQIKIEILEQWIAGKGKHPVNWKTLAKVLYDIELSTLAEEIATVKNVQIGKHSQGKF